MPDGKGVFLIPKRKLFAPNKAFEWDAPPASFACRLRAPQL